MIYFRSRSFFAWEPPGMLSVDLSILRIAREVVVVPRIRQSIGRIEPL